MGNLRHELRRGEVTSPLLRALDTLESRIEEIIVIVYFFFNEVNKLSIMVKLTVFKGGFASSLYFSLRLEPSQ